MEARLDALCEEAARYVDNGANILILSDRNLGPERVAMPSLLAVAAVHHHLVRRGTRLRTGLVIESGEPRDIHHMATLIGYGAAAINPYVMFESLDELADRSLLPGGPRPRGGREADRQGDRQGPAEDDLEDGDLDDPVLLRRADLRGGRARARADRQALHRHRVADRRGRARACSSTEAIERHFRAYPRTDRDLLPVGGVLQWRRDGELHIWNPDTIAKLQHAVGGHNGDPRARPTPSSRGWPTRRRTRNALLRGLMKLRTSPRAAAARGGRAGDARSSSGSRPAR